MPDVVRDVVDEPAGSDRLDLRDPSDPAFVSDSETSGDEPISRHVTTVDRWLVRRLLRYLGDAAVAVVLWDGSVIRTCLEKPVADVVIKRRSVLLRLIRHSSIAFANGYRDGTIEVQGSLLALCEALEKSSALYRGKVRNGLSRFRRRRSCSPKHARRNIHEHYDLGNDFYQLWLDRQLVYTCAWFPSPDVSLEEAQIHKMDLVCRKLNLCPGDEVVEAGCGWGALALHMAREYDVRVRAYNISHEQMEYAQARAKREGLSDRVSFIKDDWRNMTGEYDRFVSVGMLEHVGPENYRELGKVIEQVLRPSGTGLIHTIGRNVACPLDSWVERDIFPGAEPPSLRQMADIFEPHGFSVLDVENLRQHYALTLRHWLQRFEQHADEVGESFDESFVRLWRLYLSGSVAAFEYGALQLFQVLFSHGRNNQIPWTRSRPTLSAAE